MVIVPKAKEPRFLIEIAVLLNIKMVWLIAY